MHPVRQVGIPLEHVLAEVAAWPLASVSALRLRPERLAPDMGDGVAQSLWRDAERDLVAHFPGFLVDELVAVRDRTWFNVSREPVELHEYVRNLAEDHLEVHGNSAAPRLLDDQADDGGVLDGANRSARLARRRRAWRWLAFALPSDLLLAALGDAHGGPDSIELLSPAVATMLRDRGHAETHLHVGAGLDFPTLWVSAQATLARTGFDPQSMASPGAELDEGRQLAAWLVRGLLARYLLGAFLATRSSDLATFETYLATTVHERVVELPITGAFSTLLAALTDLRMGEFRANSPSFPDVGTLYGLVTGMSTVPIPKAFDQLDQADGLAGFFPPPVRGKASTEVRFLRAGFDYLRRLAARKAGRPQDQGDPLFTSLFWQAVRVRSLFYRHVTQRPMTPGLLWFIRFYGRISPGRKALGFKIQLESAARLGGRGSGLKSLEFRTAPSENTQEIVDTLDAIADVRDDWRNEAITKNRPELDCELGLILHFTKGRGGEAAKGAPRAFWRTTTTDPAAAGHKDANACGFRHGQFTRVKMREATALAWVLKTYPLSIQYLRGLDICTDEMGVPNWVFAPILAHVREAAGVAAGVLRARRNLDIPPLRTTVHAGEDFVHLASGLRGVAEAFEQLGLREGDRIGHGVSLGIHPQNWARRTGRVAMNRETRLFDLVWEWDWLGRDRGSTLPGRQHVLEKEIATHSRMMFGQEHSPHTLQRLRQDLADRRALDAIGFAQIPTTTFSTADVRLGLLHQYLTRRDVFDRGHDLIWIETSREAEALGQLQAELRERLASNGIVVEVNPTSNLLIGHLEDLSNHPLWRLRPPRPEAGDPPPVGVCIGSDDPITFNSNLRQEYQCLADALALGGLGDELATQWLERARQCGLDNRFTLKRIHEEPLRQLAHLES